MTTYYIGRIQGGKIMNKKKILNATLWSIVMIVVQVVVDIVRHTPINWIEVLVGAAIVFLICIGSKGSIDTSVIKKKGKAGKENSTQSNITDKDINTDKNVNEMAANMNDLRFYTYNRIAVVSLIIGVGCIAYGYIRDVENVFWLNMVGILCFIEGSIFLGLYVKKRNEFVEKASKTQDRKK